MSGGLSGLVKLRLISPCVFLQCCFMQAIYEKYHNYQDWNSNKVNKAIDVGRRGAEGAAARNY